MARSPLDQLRLIAARMTTGQKVSLVLVAALTAGAIWGTVALTNRIRYQVLFSNLDTEDASAIVAKLQDAKVPYRVDAGGTAISVPSDRVADVRLSLAAEGLPRGGGIGFEIFDRSTFDVSDFVQNVNYQRAMERELGRTIEALDTVSKARVHLVLPPRTLFAEESPESKASVVVKLYRGRELRSEQTAAIANLVAAAVRGLSPDKVSIVDTEGRTLKDGQSEDSVRELTAHQLDLKTSYEGEVQAKLVTLLSPIVGEGRVRARVNASLDFQKVERVQETYDPEGAVVRSEQKGKQKRTNGSGGGAPGTASNLPTGSPVASAPQSDTDESTDTTVNYEIPKIVSTIKEPVGELKRMSVAVVVDNAAVRAAPAAPAGDASKPPESKPRSDEEMRKLTELVRAAIGYDEKRGDVLTVENLPFDAGPVEAEKEALGNAEKREFWYQVVKYPSLVLGALLVYLFFVRPMFRSVKKALLPPPGGWPEEAGSLPAPGFAGSSPALALRQKLIEISASEPEGAAQVVKAWLKEKA